MKQNVEQPLGPGDQALRTGQTADAVAITDAVDRQIDGQEQRVGCRTLRPGPAGPS
jgi:hypothetical protein